MRVINRLRQWRFLGVLVLVLVCAAVSGVAIWRTGAVQLQFLGLERTMDGVQRGLGSEVQFAKAGASEKEILSSVESVDNFIFARANLRMSKETKDRLVGMEQNTLNGTSPRISQDQLSQALTATISNRLSGLSDREIEFAAKFTDRSGGLMTLRRSGELGATPEEFIRTAQSLRDQSKRGDPAARAEVMSAVDEAVKGRLALLAVATPEEFASARDDGITPLQAMVVTYSVAADDDLSIATDDLYQVIGAAKDPKRRPFGNKGRIFRSPMDLLFNRTTTASLLDQLEGRDGK